MANEDETSAHDHGVDPDADGSTTGAVDAPDEPAAGEPEGDAPPMARRVARNIGRSRKLLLPVLTLAALVAILLAFHSVLMPFIFAVVIVYLMEPIVRRLSPALPRWVAVILVYVAFFGVLTLSIVLIVPRFVTEIIRFAETVPEAITEFREEHLPGINEDVQAFLRGYLPIEERREASVAPASKRVRAAVETATAQTEALWLAKRQVEYAAGIEIRPVLRAANAGDNGELERTLEIVRAQPPPPRELTAPHGGWSAPGVPERPAVRVVPAGEGGFDVYLDRGEIEISQTADDAWIVRRPAVEAAAERPTDAGTMLDLEATADSIVGELVSTSNERLAAVITYAQTLVVGIIQLFVLIILTFMVAAFMSIDLPSFMRFFRELLPSDYRSGFDELMTRMDTGLAGVVRGQLFICLINGILTYIGLVILDIKFRLLLAVVAGVLSLIPIFGTIISTIPIVIIGLTSSFLTGVFALAWILGIHFIEANILNPKIIGTSAHIHPVIVVFALLAGESTFGLVGALLAVPVASILLTLFKFTRDKFWGGDATIPEVAERVGADPGPG